MILFVDGEDLTKREPDADKRTAMKDAYNAYKEKPTTAKLNKLKGLFMKNQIAEVKAVKEAKQIEKAVEKKAKKVSAKAQKNLPKAIKAEEEAEKQSLIGAIVDGVVEKVQGMVDKAKEAVRPEPKKYPTYRGGEY